MCIICVSGKGVRQPNESEIRQMFLQNPHGAGYMVADGKSVRIEKGFMTVTELLRSLRYEKFTEDDVVVYHFRISTQAGVNPEMTQPFPFCTNLETMKYLSVYKCDLGIAHNGIIRLTTDPTELEYSDTALFIAFYLTEIVRGPKDLENKEVLKEIEGLIRSKMALLDKSGNLALIGDFIEHDGLMFSNYSFKSYTPSPRQFTLDEVKRWRKIVDIDEELQYTV